MRAYVQFLPIFHLTYLVTHIWQTAAERRRDCQFGKVIKVVRHRPRFQKGVGENSVGHCSTIRQADTFAQSLQFLSAHPVKIQLV